MKRRREESNGEAWRRARAARGTASPDGNSLADGEGACTVVGDRAGSGDIAEPGRRGPGRTSSAVREKRDGRQRRPGARATKATHYSSLRAASAASQPGNRRSSARNSAEWTQRRLPRM